MTNVVMARLSALEFVVEFEHAPGAASTFSKVWTNSSSVRYLPVETVRRAHVARFGGGFLVRLGDGLADVVVELERNVCPTLEGHLYKLFLETERAAKRAVLHACALAKGDTSLLFIGQSGAGKSAMARAGLAAGWSYFADEHVVTDGELVWGVPRAIHLDMEPVATPAAPWHEGADRDAYVFDGAAGPLRVPLVDVPRQRLAERPRRLSDATLIRLGRGPTNQLGTISPAERLRLLADGHFANSSALSRVALVARSFSLDWLEPNAAFSLLTMG